MPAPKHQPQLTGVVTQSVDCGVRSTSMAVDWATRGVVRPSVKTTRVRMGLPPTALKTTNPTDWARAIESYDTPLELRGKYERLTGTTLIARGWVQVEQHLAKGHLAILAVDYGLYRRLMPTKAGSTSFSGYHAIPFRGTGRRVTSYDPLLDGRYKGCPDGPVLVPLDKVGRAAESVGRKETGQPSVYAYLVDPGVRVGSGVDIPEPEEPVTLASILSDLRDLDETERLSRVIADLETLIGPYQGEADADDDAQQGVKP